MAKTKTLIKETKPIRGPEKKRGGFRPNAGRPPGSVGKKSRRLRQITDSVIRSEKVPLRVMINNMIHYDEEAAKLSTQLGEAMAAMTLSEEGLLRAIELFAQLGDMRMKSQKCACDAAPYVHPRLSAIQMNVNKTETPRDLTKTATIDQYRESFSQLRSAPLIEQPDVEVVPETEDAD